MTRKAGIFDCLRWDRDATPGRSRGEIVNVQRLLTLRDALRANEPAPLDEATWMADAIDQALQSGGSLDQRLGLKRRGKPSIKRIAEITRRDTLIRSIDARMPQSQLNRRAAGVVALLQGRALPRDQVTADELAELRQFKSLPSSIRQVMRILAARNT